MKEIIFIQDYRGAKRGWKAIVEDKNAYDLMHKKICIISKDVKEYKNKMMTSENTKNG